MSDDHFDALAKTAARSRRSIPGTALKFSKGDWTAGEEETDAEGETLIALMKQLLDGWQKWPKGEMPTYVVGLSAEGYIPAARESLGDNDKDYWVDDKDPWRRCYILPLCDLTGKLFNFATSTVGGRGAIDDLINNYVTLGPAKDAGMMPVVELGAREYQHHRYGKLFVPTLEIVDWKIPPATTQALTAPPQNDAPQISHQSKSQARHSKVEARLNARRPPKDDMDDEIPF